MMHSICIDSGLDFKDRSITNHSMRSTGIHNLVESGVSAYQHQSIKRKQDNASLLIPTKDVALKDSTNYAKQLRFTKASNLIEQYSNTSYVEKNELDDDSKCQKPKIPKISVENCNPEILVFVLNPLQKAILFLEFSSATLLANCYLNLTQLGAVLKNLPQSFYYNFHNYYYDVMNKRFEEFNNDKYLFCFYLHLLFLDIPLKSDIYAKLAKTTLSINQNLEFDFEQSHTLCSQLNQYRKKKPPFDLKFVTEVLAETDNAEKEEDDEYKDNLFDKSKLGCCNLISFWDLNITKDLDDNFIDNEKNNNKNIILTDNETVDDTNSRDILNYNINNLLNECINEN
ncbi:hypothetical protein RhiirA5_431925 [Rhizophagus irregularis]|uniref:Uncharacterized protein n=1 Tax=Rhizophagus irregularis TaxID=588596 RepID=A0A2N0NU67_9GLOM|nr:hypothetical protein RhiirA5_431925 [Rhizophagus irregularis]